MNQNVHTLKREKFIPSSIERVFDFFSRAENLNRITPPWFHFKIVTKIPIRMTKGTLIEYSLRLHGVPIRWMSQITGWDPPHSFVDTQLKGPYKIWIHQHLFQARDGGTFMQDIVKYAILGSILEPFIHFLFVQRELDRIFDYREESLVKIFSKL